MYKWLYISNKSFVCYIVDIFRIINFAKCVSNIILWLYPQYNMTSSALWLKSCTVALNIVTEIYSLQNRFTKGIWCLIKKYKKNTHNISRSVLDRNKELWHWNKWTDIDVSYMRVTNMAKCCPLLFVVRKYLLNHILSCTPPAKATCLISLSLNWCSFSTEINLI